MPITDAHVDGFISNESNITFTVDAGCNGEPEGQLSGSVKDVFVGTPESADFTFESSSPILIGTLVTPQFLHAVFGNVTVINETAAETFEDGNAQVTAERLSSGTWRGSITLFFGGHTLTYFGDFSGNVTVNRQVLCQLQL